MACGLILLLLVFLFHAAELFYLFVYLASVLVIFTNQKNIKKVLMSVFVLVLIAWIASNYYNGRVPEIVSLIQTGKSTKISDLIHEYGKYNVEGGNRYEANWNVLYAICVACALPILVINHTGKGLVNNKVLYIVLASLAYCFIPTFKLSSGITSLFYPADILNRLYFASLLFILPSLLVYLILNKSKNFKHPIYLLLIVLTLMVVTSFYSRYINNAGTYFQNVNSIRNSLKQDKVGIDLPVGEIESIGRQIREAEKLHGLEGVHFCANYDKAHIVWFIYRQKNIRFYRNGMTYGLDQCIDDSRAAKKQLIVID
jgi:ABC-type multidrug transport system fused ATPase/permease subunit